MKKLITKKMISDLVNGMRKFSEIDKEIDNSLETLKQFKKAYDFICVDDEMLKDRFNEFYWGMFEEIKERAIKLQEVNSFCMYDISKMFEKYSNFRDLDEEKIENFKSVLKYYCEH